MFDWLWLGSGALLQSKVKTSWNLKILEIRMFKSLKSILTAVREKYKFVSFEVEFEWNGLWL